MLNIEEILIKIMQLLDFNLKDIKLKQSTEKNRFITREESSDKYSDHMILIFEKLKIDTCNNKLVEIFTELLFLYQNLYVRLYSTHKIGEKKLNWIILKRLVIPFLAFKLANLDSDYNSKTDKNLSTGRFWYLPDVTEYNKVKLPLEYLLNWWLDLYGGSLDSLCNELDEKNTNPSKPFESKNTIKQWIKKSIPDRKSIEEYCNIPLDYKGIFLPNEKNKIEQQFQEAIEFTTSIKKISTENLKHEIPYNSLVDKIFTTKEKINKREKYDFVTYIKERWAQPSIDKLVNSFFIGRSIQDLYKRLIKYFDSKDTADIEENKVLQLVHHFQHLYNIQMARIVYEQYEDPFLYYHEFISPFDTDIEALLNTLYADITIELANPNFSIFDLEDIYQVKFVLFGHKQDQRFKNSSQEMKKHLEYFHKKYDDIGEKFKEYQNMPRNESLKNIKKEESFECLYNLFEENLYKDYSLTEDIILQMSQIANNQDKKQMSIAAYLTLYTNVFISSNSNKYNEAKHLCEMYNNMLLHSGIYDIKEAEYLMLKAFFHLKSKEFKESLTYWNEYYDKYIENQKKGEETINLIKLAAYCAYKTDDKKLLKKYNNYFIKTDLHQFESPESLGFPIYFYK